MLASSLVACGDSKDNQTGTDAGPDAPPMLEPLKPGIALITDIDHAVDVTSDGRRALFWKGNDELYFYDVATGALEVQTTLDAGNPNQQVLGLSDKGHISGMYGATNESAARWDATDGWKQLMSPIPPCVSTDTFRQSGSGFGITPDGKAMVGLLQDANCHTQAFLWKDTGGDGTMIPLQKVGIGDIQNERATAVSPNGKVAAGFAPNGGNDRMPAIWKDDGTGVLLDLDPTVDGPGEIKAISADGKIFAGELATINYGRVGFTWSEETGFVRFTAAEPSFDHDFFGNAMSADGTYVYGQHIHYLDPTDHSWMQDDEAYVWSKDKGVRNLQDVATAAGITIPANNYLTNVYAVSDDGRVAIGDAFEPPADPNTSNGTYKLFVLVLPEGAL